MKDKKKGIVGRNLIWILFVLLPIEAYAIQQSDITSETFVSVNCTDTPLVEVLQGLNSQTGYNFVIPEDWLEMTISGEFSTLTLEQFFHRILKNKNFTLLINEKEKIITGREFGSHSRFTYVADSSVGDKDIDPFSGMPAKELQELHAHQLNEMQRRKADPEYTDPLSGLANGYITKLHKVQIDEDNLARKRADAIDPQSGIPLHELESLQKKQLALKDANGAVDPVSGISLDGLKILHEQQLAESKK